MVPSEPFAINVVANLTLSPATVTDKPRSIRIVNISHDQINSVLMLSFFAFKSNPQHFRTGFKFITFASSMIMVLFCLILAGLTGFILRMVTKFDCYSNLFTENFYCQNALDYPHSHLIRFIKERHCFHQLRAQLDFGPKLLQASLKPISQDLELDVQRIVAPRYQSDSS